jgi:shikimate dehydrogenase
MTDRPSPRAAILGYPVAHARSPLIHGFWLAELGLDGVYERREVKPGGVAAALSEMQASGYAGGNVTVPHKEEAFAACDVTTQRARSLGAVNTFWFEDGKIHGDNTDGLGFVAHLDATHPGWDSKKPDILVLGAGGAARGLILPLLERHPASVSITNRSEERLDALLSDISDLELDLPIGGLPWERRADRLDGFALVINTTSLGMAGQPPLDLSLAAAKPGTIIADIVYFPLETSLLAEARRLGLPTLDGLGMLLHQAAPGFERWFGQRPRVSPELRAHILADLAKPKA